ncbi:hypothetical protein F2P44_00640 [Massilia sp. CCM 8695]|uniref:Uncharacterized protein n=1 Tax=Massilia frigida TaxID=2609281 RepID=A0ABX0MXV4_9BURK|nr:hypothetical protein [Massilia frigida]NHZ77814.1 hypothetical protein [Massilia frigida]
MPFFYANSTFLWTTPLRHIKPDAHFSWPARAPFDPVFARAHTGSIVCRERQSEVRAHAPEQLDRFDLIRRNTLRESNFTTLNAADATTRQEGFAELEKVAGLLHRLRNNAHENVKTK